MNGGIIIKILLINDADDDISNASCSDIITVMTVEGEKDEGAD